ncbi:DUF2116 family Zn-ribbon domain-containing protein [Nocardiopsis sp. FIRDI 009]|uniref:DUF2116 family Zn-ribbon domain-containing protein n=1 Tax=Nocardiopsis sp. FIRDI 009 TaxID=714197 RepID=UPI000E281CD4|nr:DUF2116 family Zn-ribbon domain-containing protein [Nocardiopsis sp. FIRDI 009]
MRRHRKCVVCGAALPKNSSPRRAYCDGACRALAYRDRRKAARIIGLAVVVTRDELAGTPMERDFCPVCGTILLAGAARRADARYCSGRCRTRAWRARKARTVDQ